MFAEGPSMTLADVILFPCFFILLSSFPEDVLVETVPLVSSWYARVLASGQLLNGAELLLKVSWFIFY